VVTYLLEYKDAFLYGAGDGKIGEIVKGTAKDGKRLKEILKANTSYCTIIRGCSRSS
jgi:hypothetical protein